MEDVTMWHPWKDPMADNPCDLAEALRDSDQTAAAVERMAEAAD
jgi:hypothetical protein